MTIPLQSGIIYGPVNSRRLGRSLGVNIVSTKIKTCTLNCVYCQYGLRRVDDDQMNDIRWYPSVQQITDALKQVLTILDPKPAYITLSGNGESTLHPEFPAIVDQITQIRDSDSPESSIAILSNSSTVTKEVILGALQRLDKRIMKLDCGNEETFKRYNQPQPNIHFGEIIEGLKQMEDVTIQALFSGGGGGNYTDENLNDWVEKIKEIKPTHVQIYSLDRSYPSASISPLTIDELSIIKRLLDEENISSDVFGR
jgi:wyosine [tRNA(Phe)-imidazoG37] synthetase (radical SAM superfamily)